MFIEDPFSELIEISTNLQLFKELPKVALTFYLSGDKICLIKRTGINVV